MQAINDEIKITEVLKNIKHNHLFTFLMVNLIR